MRRSIVAALGVVACVALAACGTDDGVEGETTLPAADSVQTPRTRAQRDSAIAASKLPGSGAVGRALESAEAAGRHNAALDSAME